MRIITLVYICLQMLLISSCTKDSDEATPEPGPPKYFFKVKLDGVQYEYSYDSTICDVDPAKCDPATAGPLPINSNTFENGAFTQNSFSVQASDSFPIAGLEARAFIEPVDTARRIDLWFYVDYKLGTGVAEPSGYIGPYSVQINNSDFTETTVVTMTFTKVGPLGSIIEGNFSGEVFKGMEGAALRKVPIEGSFSVMRAE